MSNATDRGVTDSDTMVFALTLQMVQAHATARTEAGLIINAEEATLFMANAVQLIHALLEAGVKPPAPEESPQAPGR